MVKLFSVVMVLLLAACASNKTDEHPKGLDVIELSPNKWTAMTKQNILHLTRVYDLEPFLYSKKIHIQSFVVPHSHPVITLNTRNAQDPNRILSTLLHEELHWWVNSQKTGMTRAMSELKKIYPKVPAGQGATKDSAYLHLIVCSLELDALSFYLGEVKAKEVIQRIMKKDKIYPWVYSEVLNNQRTIKEIIQRNGLVPPPLS